MKKLSGLDVTGGIILQGSGGANQIVKQTSANGALSVARLTMSDLGTGTPAAGRYVDGATGAWTDIPTVGGGGSSNLDGGTATAVYVAAQIHDGGGA